MVPKQLPWLGYPKHEVLAEFSRLAFGAVGVVALKAKSGITGADFFFLKTPVLS